MEIETSEAKIGEFSFIFSLVFLLRRFVDDSMMQGFSFYFLFC